MSWITKRISLGYLSEGSAGQRGNGVSRRAIIHKLKKGIAVKSVSTYIWYAFGGGVTHEKKKVITAILHQILHSYSMVIKACMALKISGKLSEKLQTTQWNMETSPSCLALYPTLCQALT